MLLQLEREGSSGSSKGPAPEIDIPPPRPKRKPAHPYPRKGVALGSHSICTQSKLPQASGRKSSVSCGVSRDGDDVVVDANESPAPSTPETSIPRPLNCLSEMSFSINRCQQPRKRGTEEVECDAISNETQATTKVSRSTGEELQQCSSQKGVAASQSVPHNSSRPFGLYGSQMVLPYYYYLPSLGAFPNAVSMLNSVSENLGGIPKTEDVPNLSTLAASHAQLGSSLIPWLNQNPIAISAAAAAAATAPWPPGLGPQPLPPLHLQARPPSEILDMESQSTVAAAIAAAAAAAAASFADTAAWLAFHGAFSHPPNASEVRSLSKPNPVVHSASPEGQHQQSLANSSEGSKNGVTISGQTSCEEHDASTMDGILESFAQANQSHIAKNDDFLPSSENLHSSFCHCEEDALKNQENKGYSSTDNSCNMKKEKRRNGFSSTLCNGLFGEVANGVVSDTVVFSSKSLGTYTDVQSEDSPRILYSAEEQCGSSAGHKSKDCLAPGNITYLGSMGSCVEIDAPTKPENGQSYKRLEAVRGKVFHASQCMSSCGSTEDKEGKANNSSLKPDHKAMQGCTRDQHTGDSFFEVIPLEKGEKLVAHTCLKKRWQGGKIMLTHTCTSPKCAVEVVHGNFASRQGAKTEDAQKDESSAEGMCKESKHGLSLSHSQKPNESKASSSGSSKYGGHGFVPYRRD